MNGQYVVVGCWLSDFSYGQWMHPRESRVVNERWIELGRIDVLLWFSHHGRSLLTGSRLMSFVSVQV
jgi:hypothetical protein